MSGSVSAAAGAGTAAAAGVAAGVDTVGTGHSTHHVIGYHLLKKPGIEMCLMTWRALSMRVSKCV